jgi:CubicO group peptidase (beta-lactamase class C family)
LNITARRHGKAASAPDSRREDGPLAAQRPTLAGESRAAAANSLSAVVLAGDDPFLEGIVTQTTLVVILVLIPWLIPGTLGAQAPERPISDPTIADVTPAPAGRPGPTDAVELEAYLDGLMRAQMAEHDIAGATVAVVRDGALLFSKGYGWADVERRQPVDPATTLFRIGSISKLFTGTAVMQLRDEGLLDLEADVNEYLDFRIPDTYAQPITLRHLLTHAPGLEDRAFGLFGAAQGLPRGEWLRDNLPARVRPPGVLASYSNYGSALAGYIVERVAGVPWEQHIEERILGPLGVRFATGRQPLPDELAPHMSRGYRYENGRFVEKAFEWVEMAPAGSMSASANAMAAFMIAHLQEGRYRDAHILADSTAREMHAQAFASDPRVNGMALGFYEMSSHGLRIIGHSGGTQWFFSDLALIPAERLGIFVSFNSAGAAPLLTSRFLVSILDRYYPVPPFVADRPAPGWETRARGYSGGYRFLRRSYTTFEKPVSTLMELTVHAGDPGELLLRSPLFTKRFQEVEPGYFRTSDQTMELAFSEDGRGGYSHLFFSNAPPMAADKVGFWHARRLHGVLLAFSVLLFLSPLVFMPARYMLQRNVEEVRPLRGPERGLRWAALGFSVLSLAFLITIAGALDQDAFLSGQAEPALRAALVLPVVSLPLAFAVVGGAVLAVRRRYWEAWGRVHYVLFALAATVFILQLHYWNLLGWRF